MSCHVCKRTGEPTEAEIRCLVCGSCAADAQRIAKVWVRSSPTRQAPVVHAGPDCPEARAGAELKQVDLCSLRVYRKCAYCYS